MARLLRLLAPLVAPGHAALGAPVPLRSRTRYEARSSSGGAAVHATSAREAHRKSRSSDSAAATNATSRRGPPKEPQGPGGDAALKATGARSRGWSSCGGRCGKYMPHLDCQCTTACARYENCCDGYHQACPHQTMTLYHQTGPEQGEQILNTSFRLGRSGWCGGAIYFATSAQETESKAIGTQSHKGFMIKAQADLGRVKLMSRTCDRKMTGEKLLSQGYDSITFNPGDGDEYAIYSAARAVSMKGHAMWG